MSQKNKRSKNKQLTLSNFVKNEGYGQNISIKESLQRQIQKLQKIRKDIQRKRLQQNKIISNILRLQLSEQPEVQMKEQIHENEEYWIFTDQKSIDHSQFSMFKLILGDYGRTETNPSYVPLKSITQQHLENIQNTSTKEAGQRYVYQQQAITKISLCSQTQLQMKQWHQNGCIKSEYLYDYQNDFIHYLQSMQYIATQLATSTKNGHL